MKRTNYVNNKQLFLVMQQYHQQVLLSKQQGTTKPAVPDYVGRCLLLISTRLASKASFAGYTYKDDMISDGIQNCIEYIDNFDPTKSNNPFAYFTQIIKFAFIRRIDREKKQQYIKIKNLENYSLNNEISSVELKQLENNDANDLFVKTFENKLITKKKPNKSSNTITEFFV